MARVEKTSFCPRCRGETKEDTCGFCGFRWVSGPSSYEAPKYICLQEKHVQTPREEWFKNCSHDLHLAAITDAYYSLQSVLYSKVTKDYLQQITGLAKEIGKLGLAIEGYAAAKGHIEYAKPTKKLPDNGNYEEDL